KGGGGRGMNGEWDAGVGGSFEHRIELAVIDVDPLPSVVVKAESEPVGNAQAARAELLRFGQRRSHPQPIVLAAGGLVPVELGEDHDAPRVSSGRLELFLQTSPRHAA